MSHGTGKTEEAENVTIMTVPTEQAQAVYDFITSLTTGTEDVTGHAMSTRRIGGPLQGGFSGTLCNSTANGSDFNCGDNDFAAKSV